MKNIGSRVDSRLLAHQKYPTQRSTMSTHMILPSSHKHEWPNLLQQKRLERALKSGCITSQLNIVYNFKWFLRKFAQMAEN
eukprot:6100214-Amphidinium_carterae.1